MKYRAPKSERHVDDRDFFCPNEDNKRHPNSELEGEYRTALAYYRQTIWQHVGGVALEGPQYDVAVLAYGRLYKAQQAWRDSLHSNEASKAEPDVEKLFRPFSFQQDETITAEILATIAAARLGTRKPKSLPNSIDEAYRLLMAGRDYLRELPKRKSQLLMTLEANMRKTVTFRDISKSFGKLNGFPLLPTVQKQRNGGTLTLRAIEQAVKRFGTDSRHPKEFHQKVRQALSSKVISCKLLEEIRWDRFRKHFKR